MNRRNNNNNSRARPRSRRFVPIANAVNMMKGPSRRDMTCQTRKFQDYNQLAVTNVEGDFAYGITSFNVTPTSNTWIGNILATYSKLYEQYRIRRVVIRAQCGKGFTNDRRIKTLLISRVDVDNQSTSQTFNTFRELATATNAKVNTLTERGNVAICDYRPIMFDKNFTSNDVVPVLNNSMQWNRLAGRNNHQWRGAVLGMAIPEPSLDPQELKITLTQEIVIDFRGRINEVSAVTSLPAEIPTLNPPTYDLTLTLDTLRTNLLSGTYFPTNITHSIGNIGTSVLGPELVGNSFRIQASMDVYSIVASEGDSLLCNKVE